MYSVEPANLPNQPARFTTHQMSSYLMTAICGGSGCVWCLVLYFH